jgi:hypothetical protein
MLVFVEICWENVLTGCWRYFGQRLMRTGGTLGKAQRVLTLFHAALGLLAQALCVLKPHKEYQF